MRLSNLSNADLVAEVKIRADALPDEDQNKRALGKIMNGLLSPVTDEEASNRRIATGSGRLEMLPGIRQREEAILAAVRDQFILLLMKMDPSELFEQVDQLCLTLPEDHQSKVEYKQLSDNIIAEGRRQKSASPKPQSQFEEENLNVACWKTANAHFHAELLSLWEKLKTESSDTAGH